MRVGLVEFGERHDTRTNGQHYTPQQTAGRPIRLARGKLNGEVARHARHARHPRSILARMSRVSGVSVRMSRGYYEDATRKLLPWNSSLTRRQRRQTRVIHRAEDDEWPQRAGSRCSSSSSGIRIDACLALVSSVIDHHLTPVGSLQQTTGSTGWIYFSYSSLQRPTGRYTTVKWMWLQNGKQWTKLWSHLSSSKFSCISTISFIRITHNVLFKSTPFCGHGGNSVKSIFSARVNIYISRFDVSVRLSVRLSVCEGSALWSRCMPGRGEGLSRSMLATARPFC